MPWTKAHLRWLKDTGERLVSSDNKPIKVWEFCYQNDPAVLSAWAKHLRNHYCLDQEIDALRSGTGFSRKEYLLNLKFPHESKAPGPSIRAGDFAEIFVADYLQYVLGYWVPRTRYGHKPIKNESTKGCDTLAFKFIKDGSESPDDILALFEAKAQLSGNEPKPRLQEAINDSMKDPIRRAESLNALKQQLYNKQLYPDVQRVERFQNLEDRPYTERYGAAALFDSTVCCAKTLQKTSTAGHPHSNVLDLVVIRGKDLMALVHDLFRRAADEA